MTGEEYGISKAYLKVFSHTGEKVYYYDIKTKTAPADAVSVETLPIKSALWGEKAESFEAELAGFVRKLENIASIEGNFGKNSVLHPQEKMFFRLWSLMQLMGDPQVAELAAKTEIPAYQTQEELEQVPFFTAMEEGEEKNLFAFLYTLTADMQILIGVDEGGSLMLSDHPAYVYKHGTDLNGMDGYVLPLNEDLALFMLRKEVKAMFEMESLFHLYSTMPSVLNKNTIRKAQSVLFSSLGFEKTDLELIELERRAVEITQKK